jgi:hypothetical protein
VRAVRVIQTNSSPKREALIALYHSTNGNNWTKNTGWREAPLHTDGFAMPGRECTWFGITCDDLNTKIIQLNLNTNNLNGFIPGLGGLSDLTHLDLSDNRLSRSIPKELGNLSNLERLILKNNNFSGMIPIELMNLTNLMDSQSNICGNHLFTADSDLRDFLSSKHIGGDWETCQTPPYTRAINSYSDMPEDSIALVFDDMTYFDFYNNPLSEYGIEVILESSNYVSTGSGKRNIGSSIAPFKDNFCAWNVRFTFDEPVYAFGGTFLATEAVPNPFSNFIKNQQTTVTAYDIEGLPVEIVHSSSYGKIVGPIEYHTTIDNLCCGMDNQEFMASYAGFWTDIPIYAVTFTNSDRSGWASVAFSKTQKPSPDRVALLALYNATGGENWTNNTGWKEAPLHTDGFAMPGTECSWFEITCDDSNTKIIQLNLSNNNLSGFIPGLGGLSELTHLDLSDNHLSRTIPKELGNLSNLERLILKNNNLSGMIPTELMNLTNLLDDQSDICGNHLFTTDSGLRNFLNGKQIGGDWESCQMPPFLKALPWISILLLDN